MTKMNLSKKIAITLMAVMLIISAGIFIGNPTNIYASESETTDITKTLSIGYTDDAGIYRILSFTVKCSYTAVWDEGYVGYITDSTFYDITDAHVENTQVIMTKKYPSSQTYGNNKYMDYRTDELTVRVLVGVDEWGNADLWVERV